MNNSLAFQLKLVQKHVQSTAHWTLSKFEIISPYTQLHTTRVERNVEEIPLKIVKRIHKTTNSPTCTMAIQTLHPPQSKSGADPQCRRHLYFEAVLADR